MSHPSQQGSPPLFYAKCKLCDWHSPSYSTQNHIPEYVRESVTWHLANIHPESPSLPANEEWVWDGEQMTVERTDKEGDKK